MLWSGPAAAKGVGQSGVMPEAIDPLSYSRGRFVDIQQAEVVGGWEYVASWNATDVQTRGQFVNVPALVATSPGAALKLKFNGTAIGLLEVAGPDVGVIEYSVDGGPYRQLDQYTIWSHWLHIPWAYMLADELQAGEHEITIRTTDKKNEKSKGYAARIERFLVN